MTTFRNGDVCTIEVVVTSRFNETQVCVKPVDGYQDIYVKPRDLTMLRPKFEVGDRVEWGADLEWCGHILSIAEDHAWISRGGGDYATVWLPNLRRIEPEIEPEIEPAAVTATESTYVAMQAAISAAEEAQPIPDLEPRVPRFDGESGEVE